MLNLITKDIHLQVSNFEKGIVNRCKVNFSYQKVFHSL